MRDVAVRISVGDYVDRLTILELKVHHDAGGELAEVNLAAWSASLDPTWLSVPRVHGLVVALRRINAQLWALEDSIRTHLAAGSTEDVAFDSAEIVRLNDERSATKTAIDTAVGSDWIDAKRYVTDPGRTSHEC